MDTDTNFSLIIGIAISMAFSAFFSGMEIAFVSSNRMLAEMDKEKYGLSTRIIARFYRNGNNFVSTMLVGNNIALVIYGILIANLFDNTIFRNMDAAFTVPADTILSTIIVLFTGEFLPKTLFKNNPNRLLTFFSIPAYICYVVLWPISKFATFLSKMLLNLFGIKMDKEGEDEEFSKVDLDFLVQSSIDNAKSENDIDEEVKIFQNALEFSEVRVKDCMVPRTEINAVNMADATIDELQQRFTESGNSKIIVYQEDIDHIIGYVHSSDMFRLSTLDKVHPLLSQHASLLRTMPFVPETMAAGKLMKIFLQQKKSLGIVVDEYGGTSGLVSLEDIVEEIFGDIEDEHDSKKYTAKETAPNEYVLSARLEIDKINEMFNLDLPENDEYVTLGGLILHHYQSFPKLNEIVNIGKFECKILKSTMTKIELVKLKVNESQ